ncbi:MAG: hypothetical protein ACTSUE_09415 [Promethearchaeota archaeon]
MGGFIRSTRKGSMLAQLVFYPAHDTWMAREYYIPCLTPLHSHRVSFPAEYSIVIIEGR